VTIPVVDLAAQYRRYQSEFERAALRALRSGWYVLGPEVRSFEDELAASIGVGHAVGVNSGTDAITLALRASDIGPGDEVITVAHTATPTVGAIIAAGATPVLVDIDRGTMTMDPAAARAAIGPKTAAIMPVHLYGCPADMTALRTLARMHRILLIEDAAQAQGARYQDQAVGSLGDVACFSFYPTKTLGGYGDGGAVVTNSARIAERVRRLRMHGEKRKYVSVEIGINSRLDELQAALLRAKLRHLGTWVTERRRLAAKYSEDLRETEVRLQLVPADARHAYHLYVIRARSREAVRAGLEKRGVQTLVHYPVPVHLQPAYRMLGQRRGSLPETERAAREVISLPLYPELAERDRVRVVAAVRASIASR
jgi:dTDP-4-amino-4,6-dideoxygalactose transaminase